MYIIVASGDDGGTGYVAAGMWQTLTWDEYASCIGGSKGGAPGTPPPWGSKFFHFHAVFAKKLNNNSPFGSWRTPSGKS